MSDVTGSADTGAAPVPGPVLLRQRLREALTGAMKARDRAAVSALRSALGAIGNAEAVERPDSVDERLAIEQIPTGLGAAEAERRELTEPQVAGIVRAEVAERQAAALDYERAGRPDRAALLRAEAAVLTVQLDAHDAGRPTAATPG
ncbi:GatB/YqeY domain-containing protein [Streptacidiphilus sp. PB12-B1b]|uniref:GatB/YqeY domain-containing protein n=1 Tax=Streptacidiphilus sp. PB12-B1b TaxID=2705012 RepID=UPI0015FC583B|nr:GatB/YqeY domain-containing protein [Streptacidiphilus sp. PB12-B1b]QMU79868.1 GatB/YqeY domain-containing protein [Streptacidiphilus sp. PB12-B1b]